MPKSKTVEHGPSMGEMTTTSSNSLPANRAETGRFVPGQSGNPSGRPKTRRKSSALARMHTEDAICAGQHHDRSEGKSVLRISAANSLLITAMASRRKPSPSRPKAIAIPFCDCGGTLRWERGSPRQRMSPTRLVTAGMRKTDHGFSGTAIRTTGTGAGAPRVRPAGSTKSVDANWLAIDVVCRLERGSIGEPDYGRPLPRKSLVRRASDREGGGR